MSKDSKIDVLLVNGDLSGHEIAVKPAWNLTDDKIQEHYVVLKNILQTVGNTFIKDNFKDSVVLPSLGNNDVKYHYQFPTNALDAEDYYGHVYKNFIENQKANQNLDLSNIKKTFLKGGYFRTEYKGITFLNLNSLMWAVQKVKLPKE